MAAGELRVGDIGVIIERTIKDQDGNIVDVSAASTKEIIFVKPNNAKLTKAAAFSTNGTDGKIKYVTVSGDLDGVGDWKIQGRVILAAGEWRTDIAVRHVYENL